MSVASLFNPALAPQTREYVKAQFYYYGCRTDAHTIRRMSSVDFGRVNEDLLQRLEPFPLHADCPNDYHEQLMRIHGAK